MKSTVRLFAIVATLASALPAHAGPVPVQQSIAIDGDASDWQQVLLNPLNSAWDGEGASLICSYSSDRDCAVSGSQHDLARFAWTWDATHFYVYIERFHASSPWAYFQVYLDTDYDGLMATGEPVFMLRLNSAGTSGDWERWSYRANSAFGDPLEDALLHADGYDMPGTAQTVSGLPASQSGPVAGGLVWEGSIRWADLSLAGPAPMHFHASSSDSTNVPASTRDNMGTTAGRRGDTGYRLLTLSQAPTVSAAPGAIARISHQACNLGNIPARINVMALSAQGHDVTFWRDDDGDGFPDFYLARDAGGDGDMTRARDDLPIAGDGDGDGLLDLGVLAGRTCVNFILEQTYPSNSNDSVEQLLVSVEMDDAPMEMAERLDEVYIGRVTLRNDVSRVGTPGDTAWLPHVVRNNTGSQERIDFVATSTRSWPITFWSDPEGDGLPGPTSVQLFDADGSGLPDIGLTASEEQGILVRAEIPVGAVPGQSDVATVRALVQGNVRDTVIDVVTAAPPVEVAPDHTVANDDERYGAAGGTIYFAHVVRNARGAADIFDLTATTDVGWPVALLADPDGDGRPYDSYTLPGFTSSVAPSGGTFSFLARVDIPGGSATGSQARVTVTARSRSNPALSDDAVDDAFAAIVRVYEDPAHVVNISQASPCTRVHAQANGLQALSPDYRFVWRAPGGASQRITLAQADSLGRAEDSFLLPLGSVGSGWLADIQQLQGGTWVSLDQAPFDILDPVTVRSLEPLTPTLHVAPSSLTATAQILNTSTSRAINGLSFRWVVLNPDRSRYLRSNGNFSPYSGSDATMQETLSFAAGESRLRFLTVAAPSFPAEGDYPIEVWQSTTCGGEFLAAATVVRVVDDADADGLSRAQEIAAGTDPNDADSDDDGLLDGADGLTDSDGDGAIDALDCDSDDDLLFDGTEAGVFQTPAATDTAAGCFTRDAWPGDTTDPDHPDTDRGGVPDGIEDANRNGRVDAPETDPNDPADDVTADTDGDGLQDVGETLLGTSPTDGDTDDDGVPDGDEASSDSDGDGRVDALSCDADGDGLPDGLERGLIAPHADTDLAAGCFVADADPATTTNPRQADTDAGGVPDGAEDADRNGRIDASETDPDLADDDDVDGDGLGRAAELVIGTSLTDADTDDDGVADGSEASDASGDGIVDALQCDADGDGIPDGTETGATAPLADTDLAVGCFVPDADPATTTNPAAADTDGGGATDSEEDADRDGLRDAGETDPIDPADDDPDGDGLPNAGEDAAGTSRRDADSDDDGLSDLAEVADLSGDGMSDALQCDADGDGLPDGLEAGVTSPLADTDLAAGCFMADADPTTTTNPAAADTDDGGIGDGGEDLDRNGRQDAGETDPLDGTDEDPDADGLVNRDEDALGTSRRDADSDDDGLGDGAEGAGDADGDGVPDALECDADRDGLLDSVEAGLTVALVDTDLASGCFVADADPATTTDPRQPDTDRGGLGDGAEDVDGNGRIDDGERNPLDPSDDGCSTDVPAEVAGVRVARAGAAVRVSWQPLSADPCLSYNVYRSTALPSLTALARDVRGTERDDAAAPADSLVFYLVTASTPLGGEGPTGLR